MKLEIYYVIVVIVKEDKDIIIRYLIIKIMEYGTGRGKGRGGTKRRVFKTEKERKQHQLEYNREWKRINGQRKCESGDKPVLKKTTGKFLITFDS